jgi:hypothetical protein
MIDWNTEITTQRTKKATSNKAIADALAQKKADALVTKTAYDNACVIFDGVIASELEGIKTLLSNYGTFEVTTSTGSLTIAKTYKTNTSTGSLPFTLPVKYGTGIDVATNTITMLKAFISEVIVCRLEL